MCETASLVVQQIDTHSQVELKFQFCVFFQSLSPKELWHIVHQCYGTELGLTSEDDDYVSPTSEHMNGLL